MTSRTSAKRSNPSSEDGSQSDSASASTRVEEKTIPFLRRLTDMLIENEEYISFSPGSRDIGGVILGKIVVHDRVKVESTILPRYFNHSSFASLRRQLNYFSFTRIGKGRQRGATYCNKGVVELEDILSLTRRSVTSSSSCGGDSTKAADCKQHGGRRPSLKQNQEVAIVKNLSKRYWDMTSNGNVTRTPCTTSNLLSARVSPVHGLDNVDKPAPKRISLDLTAGTSPESVKSVTSVTGMPSSIIIDEGVQMRSAFVKGDDKDILAGCRALLCFSRGVSSR